MKVPENATEFCSFMEMVWHAESEPAEGGGMVLYMSPHYDRYHHALHTIQLTPARRTGYTYLDGQPATIFQFADESRIIVANNGSACRVTTKPLRARRKAT